MIRIIDLRFTLGTYLHVFLLLQLEYVHVELLLQLLVGVVDAELLERVDLEGFKTVDVQHSDELMDFLGGF